MIKAIVDTIVLPEEVTAHEHAHLTRINRIALQFFVAHLPAFVVLAYVNDTGPLHAVWMTLLVLAGPVIAHRSFESPRHVSLVHGFTAMLMGGLLVHFGQGPVQIEMHFYFFALIAMLSIFANPMVIVVAAVTVAVHHLVVWWLAPASVFNYDAPAWVVAVHAAFVVLESVATVAIARRFFDDVIGLERIVARRTAELDARNAELQLVLDTVAEGLVTVDPRGEMGGFRSAALERWFGTSSAGSPLSAYLGAEDPSLADAFDVGLEQIADGWLPLEVSLDQLPKSTEVDGRHLDFEYHPIGASADGAECERILVVLRDGTDEIQRRHAEAQRQETLHLVERLVRDRSGLAEFYEEGCDLVSHIVSDVERALQGDGMKLLMRVVHTLKGNASIFGLGSVASACHELESALVERDDDAARHATEALMQRWRAVAKDLEPLVGQRDGRVIELDPIEHARVLHDLRSGVARDQVADRVHSWLLEPSSVRLDRLAEQAKRIAARLGKPDLQVTVLDRGARLDRKRFAPVWSTFIHLVRNALDHGIEGPEERLKLGKPAGGRLLFSTCVEDDKLVVKCIDDGRGIDFEHYGGRVAATETLFAEGFSTREAISEISGRGVGLGAVRSVVEKLGGAVSLDGKFGRGFVVSLELPVDSGVALAAAA